MPRPLAILVVTLFAAAAPPAIHFTYQAIPFTLETNETPERHAPETMAGGVALFDYDNDGDIDIFFTNGADIRTLRKTSPKYSNRLFANDGKAHFTDVTAKAGLAGIGYDMGVAVGDYDADGFDDLFVAGVHHNTLYHNNGNGTFTDVTTKAGFTNRPDPEYGPLWSVAAAWFDANNDGKLDLFVVNYLAWDIATEPPCEAQGRREYCHPKMYKKTPNQLFLNNGDGTFKDISASSGIRAVPGKGMGVGIADYDDDGLMDVFVPNDKLYNSLFHNLGNGKFEEVAFKAGVALLDNGEFISGMGTDFRDINNDGHPDISIIALDDETFPLFINTGKKEFIDATASSKIGPASLPMAGYGPNIADFDNDGFKDIFITRGHVQSLDAEPRVKVAQHNTVFRNLDGNHFTPLTAEAGLTTPPPSRHRGSAFADLNADGKLDVVVTAINAPAEIWINDTQTTNHYFELKLPTTKIGTKVKIETPSGPQYTHFTTTTGYSSSVAAPLHFGLGPHPKPVTVTSNPDFRPPKNP